MRNKDQKASYFTVDPVILVIILCLQLDQLLCINYIQKMLQEQTYHVSIRKLV